MLKKSVLILAALLLCQAAVVQAAKIILVTEEIDFDWDGLRDDHSLESFLISEGHNVDVRPDHWNVLTPDKIAELNAADLIIFSSLACSDNYSEGDETTEWNSLTTPLLQMNAYFARNTLWNWVNSGIKERTSLIYAEVVDPLHPIFIDILLSSYDPDGLPEVVQIIDPLVGTGHTSFIDSTDMGNGHLIAKPVQPSPYNWAWVGSPSGTSALSSSRARASTPGVNVCYSVPARRRFNTTIMTDKS